MTGFELSSPSGAIHSVSTDSEIIQRSLGQSRAFAELFDRHARTVGGYAARRLGPDAGEDILSETFLVAFARRKSFDTAWEPALPWLYGIASRTGPERPSICDRARRQPREKGTSRTGTST